MTLFAEDPQGRVFSAAKAERGQAYHCRECRGIVHTRSGPHRRPHFFHLQQSSCRSSQKSQQHLQAQLYLENTLGCELEVRFSEINRIADAVWEREKIVFEVQCSPISDQEALTRTTDYRRQGYEVVWLLHDQRFNRRRLAASEIALQRVPHYFTDIDELGNGTIYDQRALIRNGVRLQRHARLEISLQHPVRSTRSGLYFAGDATDRWLRGEGEFPRQPQEPPEPALAVFQRWYKGLLHFLLEGVCR